MGVMRFILPPDRITDDMAQQAYLSGYDRIPWRARIRLSQGELSLERGTSESGTLQIPWLVDGHGPMVISTGTLMEGSEPYYLPLELARGKISQVRNQLSDWQMVGLLVRREVHEKVAEAVHHLTVAAVAERGSAESNASSEKALRLAVDAASMLAGCYAEQALAARRRATPKLPTLLVGNVGSARLDNHVSKQFLHAFNAACVPMTWREIETSEENRYWDTSDQQIDWCRTNLLQVCGGPLLLFDQRAIPDWIALYEDDFESLLTFATEFVQAVVVRYRNDVDLWVCAGRVNTTEVLSLTEEERIKIVAQAIELTQAIDPETPVVISVDQPWAEYLGQRDADFPPLHFADALLRADLGLAGVMLEMNIGYYPGGTGPRDALEFSRLLDYWSALQVPLYVSLTLPSAVTADPLAQRQVRVPPGDWSPQGQQAWIDRFLPLILAKPSVQGVLWNQLRDSEPHDFPHGGLFDLRRHAKPALRQIAAVRQTYLR